MTGCLDDAGLNHRPIHLSTASDVALDGRPQTQWLISTPDHISVIAGELAGGEREVVPEAARVVRCVAWDDVESVRTIAGVGSGLLQARIANQWVDLLRFSNAHAQRFHRVSRRLEQWCDLQPSTAEAQAAWEEDGASLDPPTCPSCDLRLASRHVSCPRCLERGQIMQRVWDLLRPHWKGAVGLTCLTIVGVIAELIPPKLQQYMVDHLLMGQAATDIDIRSALLAVVLALAASRVMLSVVAVAKGRLASLIGSGLTCSLRLEMVKKLQNLAIAYYDRHQVGSMISRVAHDSEVLSGLMHQLTGGFLLQIVQLIGVGAMLLWLNAKLALFTLIPVPLVFVGSWFYWKKVYPRYYRLWDASSKQMSALNGMLSGIRVVKAFAQERREYDRFQGAAETLRDWRLWVDYASARYSATMQIVFSLGGLIVWYVGGLDVIGNEMSLGELIAFLAYLAMFYAPLSAISNFTTWLTSFLSGSKRVLELLDTPAEVLEAEQPTPWDEPDGRITFDHVTFGYERNTPVLKDVSFEVEPGEMVGIVGRSGSGKTTMVNLLGRFYDVQEGAVKLDGVDVRNLSLKQLRQRLGIVFQESRLFRGAIWDNLAYGRPETTIEEGLQAAKAAGAHDFICRKQLGYETQLGERGSGLSGGEKQRLSIARTLLYDPKILVLDEATSNIDAESEKSIQEALETLVRGRTTVAIAHRLSTLRNADRILVFDRGRLVEQGSHAQLLAADGVYARLVRIQTQVSKDPNVDQLLQTGQVNRDVQSSAAANGRAEANGKPNQPQTPSSSSDQSGSPTLRWIEPASDAFFCGSNDQLQLRSGDADPQNVFLVYTFPATHPDQYLSVRTWDEEGDDVEIGLVRNLADWPDEVRNALEASLDRRYLLNRITAVRSMRLALGFLEFDVATPLGDKQFTMRWTQSRAVEFGQNGKLLIDTNDNRYVVPDVDALPPADRERFLQYIYW